VIFTKKDLLPLAFYRENENKMKLTLWKVGYMNRFMILRPCLVLSYLFVI